MTTITGIPTKLHHLKLAQPFFDFCYGDLATLHHCGHEEDCPWLVARQMYVQEVPE